MSLLFLVHVLKDWWGDPMLRSDLIGEIASFWVIAASNGVILTECRDCVIG